MNCPYCLTQFYTADGRDLSEEVRAHPVKLGTPVSGYCNSCHRGFRVNTTTGLAEPQSTEESEWNESLFKALDIEDGL